MYSKLVFVSANQKRRYKEQIDTQVRYYQNRDEWYTKFPVEENAANVRALSGDCVAPPVDEHKQQRQRSRIQQRFEEQLKLVF